MIRGPPLDASSHGITTSKSGARPMVKSAGGVCLYSKAHGHKEASSTAVPSLHIHRSLAPSGSIVETEAPLDSACAEHAG